MDSTWQAPPMAFPRLPTAAADEPALVTASNFAQVLDIEGDAPRSLLTIVAPDGRFQFFLDGQPLAGA